MGQHNDQSVNTIAPYSFATEKKTYEEKQGELLKEYPEKFALIKGQAIIAIFEDEYSAFNCGCEKYGSAPFLIQPITENDAIIGTY